MLWLQTNTKGAGMMNLGGSLMRQLERDMPLDAGSPHVINFGKLVEEHENKIRHTLNEIYFGKSRDIVHGLRSTEPLKDERQKRELAAALNKRLSEKPS